MLRTQNTQYILSEECILVKNGEECNLHKTLWCEGGLQLSDIGTNNVRDDELNPRISYDMVILDNLYIIFKILVTGYKRF